MHADRFVLVVLTAALGVAVELPPSGLDEGHKVDGLVLFQGHAALSATTRVASESEANRTRAENHRAATELNPWDQVPTKKLPLLEQSSRSHAKARHSHSKVAQPPAASARLANATLAPNSEHKFLREVMHESAVSSTNGTHSSNHSEQDLRKLAAQNIALVTEVVTLRRNTTQLWRQMGRLQQCEDDIQQRRLANNSILLRAEMPAVSLSNTGVLLGLEVSAANAERDVQPRWRKLRRVLMRGRQRRLEDVVAGLASGNRDILFREQAEISSIRDALSELGNKLKAVVALLKIPCEKSEEASIGAVESGKEDHAGSLMASAASAASAASVVPAEPKASSPSAASASSASSAAAEGQPTNFTSSMETPGKGSKTEHRNETDLPRIETTQTAAGTVQKSDGLKALAEMIRNKPLLRNTSATTGARRAPVARTRKLAIKPLDSELHEEQMLETAVVTSSVTSALRRSFSELTGSFYWFFALGAFLVACGSIFLDGRSAVKSHGDAFGEAGDHVPTRLWPGSHRGGGPALHFLLNQNEGEDASSCASDSESIQGHYDALSTHRYPLSPCSPMRHPRSRS